MLKKLVEITLVALLVAGVAGAYFKWVGALPISVTSTQKMSTFDVTGEGKVVVVPDQAMLSMGVNEEGYSLKNVQEKVNGKLAQLAKELKALGIDDKDIKTTGYNYFPDYQDRNLYRASANISVVVREMDNVSQAMDLISGIGLDNVSGPTFGLSDELLAKTTKEAREMAISKAKDKASELAGLAGMNLGRIVNISEGNSYPMPYAVREMMPIAGGGDLKTSTPVEAGSSEVVVNVTLSYETR